MSNLTKDQRRALEAALQHGSAMPSDPSPATRRMIEHMGDLGLLDCNHALTSRGHDALA